MSLRQLHKENANSNSFKICTIVTTGVSRLSRMREVKQECTFNHKNLYVILQQFTKQIQFSLSIFIATSMATYYFSLSFISN